MFFLPVGRFDGFFKTDFRHARIDDLLIVGAQRFRHLAPRQLVIVTADDFVRRRAGILRESRVAPEVAQILVFPEYLRRNVFDNRVEQIQLFFRAFALGDVLYDGNDGVLLGQGDILCRDEPCFFSFSGNGDIVPSHALNISVRTIFQNAFFHLLTENRFFINSFPKSIGGFEPFFCGSVNVWETVIHVSESNGGLDGIDGNADGKKIQDGFVKGCVCVPLFFGFLTFGNIFKNVHRVTIVALFIRDGVAAGTERTPLDPQYRLLPAGDGILLRGRCAIFERGVRFRENFKIAMPQNLL